MCEWQNGIWRGTLLYNLDKKLNVISKVDARYENFEFYKELWSDIYGFFNAIFILQVHKILS
jgi:nucleoside-specific outer membrane channel protein Tsx